MERKSMKVATATIVVSALAWGCVTAGVASAVTSTQANAAYTASIASAKANFLAAVKPSRATMVAKGKSAEIARRASVKAALIAFNSVVSVEKASSLAAEKAYKASVAQFVANPTNIAFKAAVKTNLVALTKTTAALSSDAKIEAARTAFAKARTTAMSKFKASLEISAKQRTKTLARASARYKADKARAHAALQTTLKKATK